MTRRLAVMLVATLLLGGAGLADAGGPGPVLPAGHPFAFIAWHCWTATTLDGSRSVAIVVNPADLSMKFTVGQDGGQG